MGRSIRIGKVFLWDEESARKLRPVNYVDFNFTKSEKYKNISVVAAIEKLSGERTSIMRMSALKNAVEFYSIHKNENVTVNGVIATARKSEEFVKSKRADAATR